MVYDTANLGVVDTGRVRDAASGQRASVHPSLWDRSEGCRPHQGGVISIYVTTLRSERAPIQCCDPAGMNFVAGVDLGCAFSIHLGLSRCPILINQE